MSNKILTISVAAYNVEKTLKVPLPWFKLVGSTMFVTTIFQLMKFMGTCHYGRTYQVTVKALVKNSLRIHHTGHRVRTPHLRPVLTYSFGPGCVPLVYEPQFLIVPITMVLTNTLKSLFPARLPISWAGFGPSSMVQVRTSVIGSTPMITPARFGTSWLRR